MKIIFDGLKDLKEFLDFLKSETPTKEAKIEQKAEAKIEQKVEAKVEQKVDVKPTPAPAPTPKPTPAPAAAPAAVEASDNLTLAEYGALLQKSRKVTAAVPILKAFGYTSYAGVSAEHEVLIKQYWKRVLDGEDPAALLEEVNARLTS